LTLYLPNTIRSLLAFDSLLLSTNCSASWNTGLDDVNLLMTLPGLAI
jgi:hypothetical protein